MLYNPSEFSIINASQHGWSCGYFALIIIINTKLDKSGYTVHVTHLWTKGKYELCKIRQVCRVSRHRYNCLVVLRLAGRRKLVHLRNVFCWTKGVHLQYFCNIHTSWGGRESWWKFYTKYSTLTESCKWEIYV